MLGGVDTRHVNHMQPRESKLQIFSHDSTCTSSWHQSCCQSWLHLRAATLPATRSATVSSFTPLAAFTRRHSRSHSLHNVAFTWLARPLLPPCSSELRSLSLIGHSRRERCHSRLHAHFHWRAATMTHAASFTYPITPILLSLPHRASSHHGHG